VWLFFVFPLIHTLTREGFGAGAAVGSGIINAIF
jgi:hypothetical protein